jgi:DNA-binding GntR family transcriptional regulator
MRAEYANDMANEHMDVVHAIHRKDSAAARLAAQTHIDRARIRVTKANRSNSQGRGLFLAEHSAPNATLEPGYNKRG